MQGMRERICKLGGEFNVDTEFRPKRCDQGYSSAGPYRMTKQLTALIIDDHAVVRAGCRLILQQRNWEILEATTGKAGLDLNVHHQPELIVLDLGLPDAGGLDILKKLVLDNTQTRILVFTMHEDPVLAMRASEGGAHGYITKGDGPDSFVEAVDEIPKESGHYLSRVVA